MGGSGSASNQMSVCERFRSVISRSPAFRSGYHSTVEDDRKAGVAGNKNDSVSVPIIFDSAGVEPRAKDSAILLQIHGKETKEVAVVSKVERGEAKTKAHSQKSDVGGTEDEFSEYINRAGSKIRAASTVGVGRSTLRRDSFHEKVSDYIARARSKFHTTPSFVESSKTRASMDGGELRRSA